MHIKQSLNNDIREDRPDVSRTVSQNSARWYCAALVGIIIISAAVYINTIQNGFVYDDTWQVVRNSWIRDVRFIPDIVTSDVWKFSGEAPSNYYRPMMYLIYMVIYHLFGLDPRSFHALNILLNTLVCVLVFMTTVKLFQQLRPSTEQIVIPSFAAAVLFATHPVHTEAVAWIAGVPELSYSLFCLLSFYLYARSREGANRTYVLSILAFVLATFCKEPALLFPLVLIAYDHCLGMSRGENLVFLRRYVAYFAAGAIYLAMRGFSLGKLLQTGKHHQLDVSGAFINIFPLFSAYMAKLIWPFDLNAYIVFDPISSLMTLRGGAGIVALLVFIILLVTNRKKNGLVFLGLSLIVVPLLPALYIPALPENMFAERYLYLPSAGFCLLIAVFLGQTGSEKGLRAIGAGLLTIAVIASYATGTVVRNAVWKDDVTFYSDVVRKSPNVPMMHVNLGWTYFRMGRIEDAFREYRIALELKPGLAEAHNNIGMIYERQNLIGEAVNEYRTALEQDPNYPAAHINLGNAYTRLGLVDNAISEYRAALQLSPRSATAHYNLGNVFANSGLLDEAIGEYRAAIELRPFEVDYRINLGLAYMGTDCIDKAIQEFDTAVRLAPGSLYARQNLERALGRRRL